MTASSRPRRSRSTHEAADAIDDTLDAANGGARTAPPLIQGPFGNCAPLAVGNAIGWTNPGYMDSFVSAYGFDTRVSLPGATRTLPFGTGTLENGNFVRGGTPEERAVMHALGQSQAEGLGLASTELNGAYARGSMPEDAFRQLGYQTSHPNLMSGIQAASDFNEPLVAVQRAQTAGGDTHALAYRDTIAGAEGSDVHRFFDSAANRVVEVPHDDLWIQFHEHPQATTLGSRIEPTPEVVRAPTTIETTAETHGFGRTAGVGAGVVGAGLYGTGLIENLARDGVNVPEPVLNFARSTNEIAGTVLAPLAPLQLGGGDIQNAVTAATGSHAVGFTADVAANVAAYASPVAPLVAAYSVVDHMANRSDFALAGRQADQYVRDLGINTDFGTFGHDLATEFRAGASRGQNLDNALSTFGQLYTHQNQDGSLNLTGNGYSAANTAAQDRLLELRDVSLSSGVDPGVAGGQVSFPDGTSANWVNPAYADAMNNLTTNHGYGADYLGNMTPDEVINLSNHPPAPQQNAEAPVDATSGSSSVVASTENEAVEPPQDEQPTVYADTEYNGAVV